MNYAAFEEMAGGTLVRRDGEDEQVYMERIFREVCRNDGFYGPDTPCSEHRINDMLSPSFAACSAEEKTLTLAFSLRDWMLNPKGTLHGGIMSTMLDMTMGMLTRYERKTNLVSTVSLSVDFLRPVCADSAAVCAHIRKAGRTVVFAEAKLTDPQGRLCADAQATFM